MKIHLPGFICKFKWFSACVYLWLCEQCDGPHKWMQHQWGPQCPAHLSQAWGNHPGGCVAHQLCRQINHHPEEERESFSAFTEQMMMPSIRACCCFTLPWSCRDDHHKRKQHPLHCAAPWRQPRWCQPSVRRCLDLYRCNDGLQNKRITLWKKKVELVIVPLEFHILRKGFSNVKQYVY